MLDDKRLAITKSMMVRWEMSLLEHRTNEILEKEKLCGIDCDGNEKEKVGVVRAREK